MGGSARRAKRCNRVVELLKGKSNPATLIFASPKIGNSFERLTDAGTRRDLAVLEYALTGYLLLIGGDYLRSFRMTGLNWRQVWKCAR
jgi:hypothetical protein